VNGKQGLRIRFIVSKLDGTAEYDFYGQGEIQGAVVLVEVTQDQALALGHALTEIAGGP
jgi:hypothetical protein